MTTNRNIQQVKGKPNRNILAAGFAVIADAYRNHYPLRPVAINWLKGLFIEPGIPGTESSAIIM